MAACAASASPVAATGEGTVTPRKDSGREAGRQGAAVLVEEKEVVEAVDCGGALTPNAKKREDHYDPAPRKDYLSWDDYFMCVASLSALRSKDPNKQVGACIASSDNVILGIGYNGFPRGCSDDMFPWAKKSEDGNPLDTKYPYVCHAEMNAIMNKNAADLRGATMYVSMFPCNKCAQLIIQAGITTVVFQEDKRVARGSAHGLTSTATPTKGGIREDPIYTASNRMLQCAGVELRQHTPRKAILVKF